MIVVDNKELREPNLLTPRKKPVGNVEVDLTNPLADKLHTALLFDNPANFNDVVNNKPWYSNNGTVPVGGSNGGGQSAHFLDAEGVSEAASIALDAGDGNISEELGDLKPFSIFTIFKPRTFGDSGFGRIYDNTATAGAGEGDNIRIWLNQSQDAMYSRVGDVLLGMTGIGMASNLDKWWYLCIRQAATGGVGGKTYAAWGIVGDTYDSDTSVDQLSLTSLDCGNTAHIGNSWEGIYRFEGEFLVFYMWLDRFLYGADVRSLAYNHYQILKPT